MRFFTMAWWCGTRIEGENDPLGEYTAHFAAIRNRLPPALLATEESVSLHDTRLRTLFLVEDLLSLGLDSYAGDERFALSYRGVMRFESTADPNVGLGRPAGYGDLGYCEVDILPDGSFEHRLLFSTGIELAVIFRDFELQRIRLHQLPG